MPASTSAHDNVNKMQYRATIVSHTIQMTIALRLYHRSAVCHTTTVTVIAIVENLHSHWLLLNELQDQGCRS